MRGRRTKPRRRIPFEPGTPGEGVDLMHEDSASIRSRRPSPSYRSTANVGRPSDDGTSYNPARLADAAELLRQLQHANLVADDLLVSRHRVVSSLRYSMSTLGDDTPTIAACQISSKRIHLRRVIKKRWNVDLDEVSIG